MICDPPKECGQYLNGEFSSQTAGSCSFFFLFLIGNSQGGFQLTANSEAIVVKKSNLAKKRTSQYQPQTLLTTNTNPSSNASIDGVAKVFISQSLASHKAATPMGACQSVPAVTSPILWTDCKSFFRFKTFFSCFSCFLVSLSCLRMLLYIRIIYLVLNLAYQ